MISIAETGSFQRKSNSLLSTEEKDDLIAYLAEHPNARNIIQGTNGVRKIRWARGNRGKSAGLRIIYYYLIYYYHSEIMPLYLLTVFGKNEKANLSMEEKHILSTMVKELVVYWRYRNEQGIH